MSRPIEHLSVDVQGSDFSMAEIAVELPDGTIVRPETYRIIRGETPVIVIETKQAGT